MSPGGTCTVRQSSHGFLTGLQCVARSKVNACTYPVEMDGYAAIGVDSCGFTMKGHDLAEDTHSLVHEILEVLGVYTGGCFGGHVCWDG